MRAEESLVLLLSFGLPSTTDRASPHMTHCLSSGATSSFFFIPTFINEVVLNRVVVIVCVLLVTVF